MQAWIIMIRTSLRFTTILLLLSLGCGCASPEETNPDTFSLSEGIWPFWPVSMRFHPLTRLVVKEDEEDCTLEARLEFKDLEGDISKALGKMNIQLYEMRSDDTAGEFIANWDIDLENRQVNRTHYSVITRTYLLRLVIKTYRNKLREKMVLLAEFKSVDGQVFTTKPTTIEYAPPPKPQD